LFNFFSHLIPFNTPFLLIHFMVLVELISSLIRPFTLAIRLIANITAGHLILALISSLTPLINRTTFIITLILGLILIIELGVAVIQGYIYSVLLLLYLNDSSK